MEGCAPRSVRLNPLKLSQIDKLLESFDFVTAGTQARYRLSNDFLMQHMQHTQQNPEFDVGD